MRSLRVIISLAGQSSPFVQMQIPNVGSSFQASGKHEAKESSLQEGQPLRKKGLASRNGIAPYHLGRWQSKKAVRLCRCLQAWQRLWHYPGDIVIFRLFIRHHGDVSLRRRGSQSKVHFVHALIFIVDTAQAVKAHLHSRLKGMLYCREPSHIYRQMFVNICTDKTLWKYLLHSKGLDSCWIS